MTRLVERIVIDVELDSEQSTLERDPRAQLRDLWPTLGHLIEARGKWRLSSTGVVCWITNLGLEEVPEEGGGDN